MKISNSFKESLSALLHIKENNLELEVWKMVTEVITDLGEDFVVSSRVNLNDLRLTESGFIGGDDLIYGSEDSKGVYQLIGADCLNNVSSFLQEAFRDYGLAYSPINLMGVINRGVDHFNIVTTNIVVEGNSEKAIIELLPVNPDNDFAVYLARKAGKINIDKLVADQHNKNAQHLDWWFKHGFGNQKFSQVYGDYNYVFNHEFK